MFSTIQHTDNTYNLRKITVVGAGAVGLAAAYAILNQGLCSELALVDINKEKLTGEMMDLCHGAAFIKNCRVIADTDFVVSANSDLVIVTAGARQREGETRLQLVGRNVEMIQSMMRQLVKHSPNACFVLASNPVDIMTHAAAKLAGLPAGRVFGTGCVLDSSRFRTLVAQKLDVDARSVHGFILGEHGDSSIACWSNLSVGGSRIRDNFPNAGKGNDEWESLHKEVINSAYKIISAKGYTNWAIGLACANVAEAVLRNENRVMPVSVNVKGYYGIEEDVCLSLPAVVGRMGVNRILQPHLDEDEVNQLRKSAKTVHQVQATLNY